MPPKKGFACPSRPVGDQPTSPAGVGGLHQRSGHALLFAASRDPRREGLIPAKGVGEYEDTQRRSRGLGSRHVPGTGKKGPWKTGNHSLARGRSTCGQTVVPRGCFGGEAKFDWAKREAKRDAARQTLVPVTLRKRASHLRWARQGSNLQGFLQRILSPSRLPIPPRAHCQFMLKNRVFRSTQARKRLTLC